MLPSTVYPKKYAHGFCFAVLCCGYTLTDFPISIRLTSLALWQSNDCPSASKATLMNMDKYFMWIHYERLRNHNKAKHNKTVCMFLGIYCSISCHKAYRRFARNSFPNLTGLRMVMTTTQTLRNYMHIPLTNRSVCFHGYHSLYFLIKALTMMTSSHGNMSALLALCAGNSPVTGDAELWCFLSSVPEFTVE